MAKCTLARHVLLSTEGSFAYATPSTVEKAKDRHNLLLETVNEAFKTIITGRMNLIDTTIEKLCLTVNVKDKCHIICGMPDTVYFLYGGKMVRSILLVLEATLSPSVKHLIWGEMLFYTLAVYMNYGCATYGLVVTPNHVYLVAYKTKAAQRLRTLLRSPTYEKAVEIAERLKEKKPWMCSLCDLKHLCPLGAEL